MARASLGKMLTDVLNEAADVGEQVIVTTRSFHGIGEVMRHSMTGNTDLDELLCAMKPDHKAEDAQKNRKKQEEFSGPESYEARRHAGGI
ncbi:hypothetical protein ACWD7F_34150 [Streptomyces sp. NPDC005122]